MANEEIQAKFGADTSPVDRALRGLTRQMTSWGRSISNSIKSAFSTLAAPLSIAGVVAGMKSVIDNVERLRASSDAWGASLGFVQDLSNIAKASGLAGEKVSTMVDKWVKSLPAGSDVEQEFMRLADRIAAIPDPVSRAQVAIEVFGRTGVDMLRIVQNGSEGIREMASQFSKLSDSEVKAIERLDQILDESGNTFSVWAGKALAAMVAVARFTGWLASKPMQTAGALMRGDRSFFVREAAAWGVSEAEDTTAADAAKREAQKRAAEAAKVVEAQKLVDDAKKIEDEQALKSLPLAQQIARLESDRAKLAKIISSAKATDVDRAKAMLGHAKVGVELAEKQKRLQDEIARGKATEAAQQAQINTLRERAANARQNLATTRSDFTRWGIEELAQQPNNLPNTRAAREAVRQLEFARIGTMIGGPVGERLEKFHLANYENLVKQNPALRSSDRDPFGSLVKQIQESDNVMQDILTKQGIKVSELVTGE